MSSKLFFYLRERQIGIMKINYDISSLVFFDFLENCSPDIANVVRFRGVIVKHLAADPIIGSFRTRNVRFLLHVVAIQPKDVSRLIFPLGAAPRFRIVLSSHERARSREIASRGAVPTGQSEVSIKLSQVFRIEFVRLSRCAFVASDTRFNVVWIDERGFWLPARARGPHPDCSGAPGSQSE